MRWTLDRAVRVLASAGALRCVLGQELFPRSTSLGPGVQMGTDEFTVGGNPATDGLASHRGE